MKPTVRIPLSLLMPRINARRPMKALVGGGAAVLLTTSTLFAQAAIVASTPVLAEASDTAVEEAQAGSTEPIETAPDGTDAAPLDNTPADDLNNQEPGAESEQLGEFAEPDAADEAIDEIPLPEGGETPEAVALLEDGPTGPDATMALATGMPMAQGVSADPLDALLQTVALRQEEGSPVRVITADAATGSVVYFDAP